MNTLQSELYRIKLTTEVVEPKMESNFETLLINDVSKSEVSTRCQMIRKGIKEKFKLYDTHQKNGDVKILYKKGDETKMARHMSQERYIFLRTLVEYLIGNELKMKSMFEIMKCSKEDKNSIRNFLARAKVAVPEFITNDVHGMWKIDPNISVDQFMSLYAENISKYWKKYQKPVKLIPKTVEKPETKTFQVSARDLSELLEFLKNNKIALDVSGAINVTVNVKFDIR